MARERILAVRFCWHEWIRLDTFWGYGFRPLGVKLPKAIPVITIFLFQDAFIIAGVLVFFKYLKYFCIAIFVILMIGQFIVNGVITGIIYSLLAIGFAVVYNTTRIFHIAAAGIYVFAAYMFWLLVSVFSLPVLAAFLVAIVLTMLLSLLTELVVYRPLKNRNASMNVMMIASIGLMTVIVNVIAMFFGNETKVIENKLLAPFHWGDIIITQPQMYQAVVGGAVIMGFAIFLLCTRWGLKLRALSTDEALFETLGFDTRLTRTNVFLVSGAFIAIGSCLTVYDVGLDPNMGMSVIINAMVAMIIGGVGKFNTCVLGGIALGVLQSLTVYAFASNWQNAVTFLVLLIFLFLRPQGIAGYKQRTV